MAKSGHRVSTVRFILRQYANFGGRATRTEYWWFVLTSLLICFVATLVLGILASQALIPGGARLGSIIILFWLMIILPSLAITVRRLHDTGRSAWNLSCVLLLCTGACFFPFLLYPALPCGTILIVLLCLKSQAGANKYGEPSGAKYASVGKETAQTKKGTEVAAEKGGKPVCNKADKHNASTAMMSVFGQYANFNGRVTRAEYWWYIFVNAIVGTVLVLCSNGSVLTIIVLPSLAMSVRRLHDTGRSAWSLWWLLFLPVLISFLCKDSQPFTNEYGESEKYPKA